MKGRCAVRLFCLAAAQSALTVSVSSAQDAVIRGTARLDGRPLPAVLVEARASDATRARGRTDETGRYELRVVAGDYVLVFALNGFVSQRMDSVVVTPGEMRVIDVDMVFRPVSLNPVVVAASRRSEKALEAPAALTVVGDLAIQERVTTSPLDQIVGLTGVDVAVQGLQARQAVARGFNGNFGAGLLMLSDYRSVALPSLRANLSPFVTPAYDDLDHIEVVRGPASALYGPDAADGVVHFITKSPFDSPGSRVTVTTGGRSVFETSGRVASILSDRLATRVSATYFRGEEWRAPALATEIVQRDPLIERANTDLRADLRVSPTATAVFSAGSTFAIRDVEYTAIGTTQVKQWRTDFGQVRYNDGRFFAQVYLNANHAGETYLLQTNSPVKDQSTFLVAQAQHGFDLANRTSFTYGVDFQRTDPQTGGTVDGRYENDDISLQAGVYGQGITQIGRDLQLITAARVDEHNRLNGAVLSPRIGIVYTPRQGESLRLTYNRAFATPTSPQLFVDLVAAKLDPLPYNLRAVGIPKDGFQFGRTCNGPCMTSPFAGPQQLPLDATAMWPAVVAIMRSYGVDLSGIPAPSASDVKTVLRLLDLSAGVFRAYDGGVDDVAPLQPTLSNSFEAGYKRLVGQRFLLDASVYFTRRRNFVAPLVAATPNAFLSTSDLTAYLARYMQAAQADGLARVIGGVDASTQTPGIPLGTVTPTGSPWGSDILLTYHNFGNVQLWGSDLSAEFAMTDRLTLSGGYAFVSRVFFPARPATESDLSMNTPQKKANFAAVYREPGTTAFSTTFRARYVGGFHMVNGVWLGDVKSFAVVDAEAGATVPALPSMRLTLSVQNVADAKHEEFVGAPVLGRLILVRTQYEF